MYTNTYSIQEIYTKMLLTGTVTPGLVVAECVTVQVGVVVVVVVRPVGGVLGCVLGGVLDCVRVDDVVVVEVLGLVPVVPGVVLDGVSVEGVEGLGVGVVVDGLGVGVVVGLAIASRFVLPKMRVFLLMSIATSTPLW